MDNTKSKKLKQKVIIRYGYNGSKFQGSQIQKDTDETLEHHLLSALHMASFIHSTKEPKKLQLARTSRTDKGVHAIDNAISLFINIDVHQYQNTDDASDNKPMNSNHNRFDYSKIRTVINANLNLDLMRVFIVSPVTQHFDPKKYASSRSYEYWAPIQMFSLSQTIESDQVQPLYQRIDQLFRQYIGTKRYHNFTVKVQATDACAQRHLMDLSTELKGEWIKFNLQGQSFMYHQIRKMVGLIAQIILTNKSDQFFNNVFFNNKMYIWLAPSDGLLLDRVHYSGYNNKSAIPASLELEEEHCQEMEKFKQDVIYPEIEKRHSEDDRYSKWKQVVQISEYDPHEFV